MPSRLHRLWSLIAIVLLLSPLRASAAEVTDLPITQTLTFPQLSAPVDVVRDSLGIPHVYGANLNDTAFALGYVHATDRMFQMDVFRRLPSGTVSELLGFPDLQIGAGPDPTVPPFPGNISNVTQDLFFQTLGLRRAAVDSFNAYSPSVQSALQSYADGVNEYVTRVNTTGQLPPEYAALNIDSIAPWVPVDSVVFGKLQAFQLSFDFDDGPTGDLANVTNALGGGTGTTAYYQDLSRFQPAENAFTVPDASNAPIPLTAISTAKQIMVASARDAATKSSRALDAPRAAKPAKATDGLRRRSKAEQAKIIAARKATLAKAREMIAKLMEQPAMRAIRERGIVGSNEWAVDGSVTPSGNPILANDPHLGLSSPATFYELHINTKDRGGNVNATGIGFAGAPGVVQGHNEDIAWGSTTNPTDVTDWYLEDISSNGSGQLFSHYLGNPEPVQELPLQVKVNVDNGNLVGFERAVLAQGANLPFIAIHDVVDVTALLANFVPPKILIVPRHGPIFPQTLEPYPFPNNHSGGSALTVQFTGLFPTRELETFFVWNQATDLNEFKTGLQLFDFGSQNWGYADKAGNIAYFASGEFPIREDIDAGAVSGNPPFVIRNGTGGNEWKALGGPQPADQSVPYEIVPPAEVAQIENPPAHFFVNANNDPVGNTADNDPLDEALAGTGHYLGVGYDEFRAARITELIKSELNLIATPPGTPVGDGQISFADMQRMQADVNQMEARRLAGYFVTAVNNAELGGAPAPLASLLNSRVTDARDRLTAWTYNTPTGFDTPGDPGIPSAQDLVDSVATTIYNVAVGQLMTRTFDAKLAASGVSYRQGTSEGIRGLLKILDKVPYTGVGVSGLNFFDDTAVSLSAAEERDILLVKSLQGALDLLGGANFVNAYANSLDVDDYLWGKVHYVIFQSFLNGELNNTQIPGGGVFSIPPQPASFPPGKPADGARFTVDVANYGLRPTSESGLSFGSGPNRRSVVEMGPSGPVQAKNVIPGGEDGVVGRPHYGDQIDLWLGNGYHDTLLATDDVVADAASRDNFASIPGCTESGTGRCVPGKGGARTDCATEFFVDAPKTADEIKKAKLSITDGGSSDFDGSADGRCVAHVVICVNNNDPRLVFGEGQQCSGADIDVFQLSRPKPDASRPEDQQNSNAILAAVKTLGPSVTTGDHGNIVDFGPAITSQDRCVGTYVTVPLRNGHRARKTIGTKTTRSDGTKDIDSLTIVCNP
jgi:penicillin G amidase